MILRRFFIFVFLLFSSVLHAQDENVFVEDKTELRRNEMSFGAILHSNGWGIDVRRCRNKTAYNKHLYEIEIVGMNNPKEFKTTNPYYDNEGSYILGKLNSLLLVRTGTGFQKIIYSKGERGGLEVRMCYSAGISWGFAKPVYLDILKSTNFIAKEIVVEKYDPEKHTVDNILGKASFTNGLNELKINPGGYAKFGFNFEFASSDTEIRAIETGVCLDGFFKPIPIMAYIENKPYFLSFYVNILWGKKW